MRRTALGSACWRAVTLTRPITTCWGLVGVTAAIAAVAGRTPLEVAAPRLDAQLVQLARRMLPRRRAG